MVDEANNVPGAGGNRRALVHAAYARIAADGFEGLRTREVAADAGVNIGTLHYYFPSKEALIHAAVRHTTTRFATTLSKQGSPAEQLRAHLEGLRHLLKTDMELWAVLNETTLRAARDASLAEIMRQADEQWFGYVRGLVARGVEEGGLDRRLDPENAAAMITVAIKGLSMSTLGPTPHVRIDQTIDQLEQWLGFDAAMVPVRRPASCT